MERRATNDDVDGEQMGFWLERLQPDLRRMALALAKNSNDAADLLQATCLRALEKRRKFIHGTATDLRNWLTKMMRNLHLDRLRRRASEVLVDDMGDVPAPDVGPLPSWKMLDEPALWAAIGQLRPALREVYRLVAIERLPYRDIAVRLRISVATIATRIHRARASLRCALTTRAALDPARATHLLVAPTLAPPRTRAIAPIGGGAIARRSRPAPGRGHAPPSVSAG